MPIRCARREYLWLTVAGFSAWGDPAIRRYWWVLVSFSHVSPSSWAIERATASTPFTTSRLFHRSTHSSLRRKPVTIVSHTNTAQSGIVDFDTSEPAASGAQRTARG